jgi:hypothetical protein
LNETKQLDLLSLFATRYREEYEKLPRDQISEKYHFFLNNVNFSSVDAELLFCMVRHFKPRRIVEIGSGSSTLLAADALARNHKEGFPGTMLAIEPFPRAFLRSDLPAQVELLPQVVQNIPLKEFEALHENDILFIDSSHVCKIGSDVQYEFLEILPRLAPGVLVHVHDIFLPVEYPESWLRKDLRFWNEQYLLQAFLCLNDCFEVLWAGHWLHLKHPDRLAKAFRSYGRDALPRSFWIRRVK